MFSLYNFIFQRLIWKAISFYFLWLDYWILKKRKTAKVHNHCLSILFTQMIDPPFDMFTGGMLIFFARFLNMCEPRMGWPTSIGILWKWASKLTELAGDGEYRMAWFHSSRNFIANEIYHFSGLSHQTGCLFTWAAHSI